MYDWFTIIDTFPLADAFKKGISKQTTSFNSLEVRSGYIAEIEILSHRRYQVRIDALPFLRELLGGIATFARTGEFDFEIGEGLSLHGVTASGAVEIKVLFLAGGMSDVLLHEYSSPSNTFLFLNVKAAELAQSLEQIGVKVENYLTKFPVRFSQESTT